MQPLIECLRVQTRLRNFCAALAALLVVALPRFAMAAPPAAQKAAEEAAEPAGFFTPAWWQEKLSMIVSDDMLQMGWSLVLAVLMFLIGWGLAKGIAGAVFRLLTKTDLDNKLAAKLGITMLLEDRAKKPGDENALERGIAKIVYWLLMALVVVAVLDYAGLEQAAAPIQRLVDTVIQALPLIGKAILILVVAWVAGSILRMLVTKTLKISGVDKRLAKYDAEVDGQVVEKPVEGKEGETKGPKTFSESVGQVVFWLIMILGLAGAFDALQIEAISAPLSNVVNTLMGLLPIIGIAALIMLGGYILSKVVRVIVTRALESMGFDNLVSKFKLQPLFGTSTPSKVVGWLVSALIIVQTVIAALHQVGLETLSRPMTDMMAQFWDLLPRLAISLVFIVLGVFAGRLLRGIVHKALVSLGFDKLMDKLGFGQIAERDDDLAKPAGLVAFVVQVVVVLLAVAQALDNLDLHTWANYVDAFLRFAVTRAAVAMLIVGVGFVVGNYVRDLIEARNRPMQPDTTEATREPVWMAEFARYAVLVFAFTMAVHQLGVAEDFVLLSFALLFGALCLAGALAFGLGSRDLAGEIVRERYRKAKQGTPPSPSAPTTPASPFGGVKPPTKPPGQ